MKSTNEAGRSAAIESAFVETFVAADRRERSKFELGSPRRRRDFYSRLCHAWRSVLREDLATPILATASRQELLDLVTKHGAKNSCYVMSFHREIDGVHASLSEALAWIDQYGMPVLVVFGPSLALFKGELEAGAADLVLLMAKR